MSDKKIPSDWKIGNESFANATRMNPGSGDFGKSYSGAEGLWPVTPTNSNATQSTGSTAPSTPTTQPNTSNTPQR